MFLSSYDAWKLRSPDDERDRYWPYQDEPQFWCDACEDSGWIDDNGRAVACTECSDELTIDDVAGEGELNRVEHSALSHANRNSRTD